MFTPTIKPEIALCLQTLALRMHDLTKYQKGINSNVSHTFQIELCKTELLKESTLKLGEYREQAKSLRAVGKLLDVSHTIVYEKEQGFIYKRAT